MRWHVALRVIGAALLMAAATVLSLQVHVGGSGASGRTCGSAFDVLADRAGWEEWYAQDRVDATTGSTTPLLRTLDCPHAVNRHSLIAGSLGVAAVGALVLSTVWRRPRTAAPVGDPASRLRRLGRGVTITGTALALAGVVTLVVLLANRDSTLFVYVKRPFVAVVGLVILVPVLALIAGGRALVIVARALEHRNDADETA